MAKDVTDVLKTLNIKDTGKYEDQQYVITLDNSNDYAKMYTTLDTGATNVGYPDFGTGKSNSVEKITNYFELVYPEVTFSLTLDADCANDKYSLTIKEKTE